MRRYVVRLALASIAALPIAPAAAQIPSTFTNLQALPKDISRDSLVQTMRRFALSLNVRCQYCHVGGDGQSFTGVDFASDADPDKLKARFMLRMVDSLNRQVLPRLPGASANPVRIECKTCHRGAAQPLLLTQLLERVRIDSGIATALLQYRKLRQEEGLAGRYDFTEWEMNLWAERLAAAGNPEAAIAVYELNREFFPESAAIRGALQRLKSPRPQTPP